MMIMIPDTSKFSCLLSLLNVGRSIQLLGILVLLCITESVQAQQQQPQQQQQQQQQPCERLKTSLTYAQEDAPSDLSGVLPVIVERINRELDGVIDVEVNWKGSDFLKGTAKVGEHIIQCTVTRLASSIGDNTNTTTIAAAAATTTVIDGRTVMSQCYHIPFTISDTNECTLRLGHPMRHVCDERSTICVNTIGSYECVCPRLIDETLSYSNPIPGSTIANPEEYLTALNKEDRGLWELSYKTLSTCPSSASTYGCCRTKDCRAAFVCPLDPCSRPDLNDCSQLAKCVRKATPTRGRSTTGMKDFTCKCPTGYMGNGHSCTNNDPQPQPKVMFDGITPTEETLKNNLYCDCTVPIIDACAGFPPCEGKHQECVVDYNSKEPKCACKKGYMLHETYGCVDENPPALLLKHDPNKDKILRLKQGDTYTEYAVDIHDENAEEYLRSLKIAYSQPLPPKCLSHVGEFHVNYTIATPWTIPPYVRVTRRVIIEDINECTLDVAKYNAICPELVPKCDPIATCVNTIGSYKCQCPKYTSGDGFQKGIQFLNSNKPDGYISGQGCIDTTKPTIQIQGPNPKIFRVAECTGISSIIQAKNPATAPSSASSSTKILSDKLDLKRSQQSYYNDDIKKLIKETSGAELCATFTNTNPDPTDCIYAFDLTPTGRVDLSRKVVIGDPVQKSSLRWSVPYNVNDEAGNAAETVWRDVIVEEVKLSDIENSIRKEVLTQQNIEINKAVEKAVTEERKRYEKETATRSRAANQRNTATTCPECPKCSSSSTTTAKTESGSCPALNKAACAEICKSTIELCAIDEKSFVIQALLYLEKIEILNPSFLLAIAFCVVGAVGLLVLRAFLSWILNTDPYRASYDNPAEAEERQRRLLESVQYYNTGASGTTPLSSNGDRDIFLQPTTPGSVRDTTVNGFIPPPRQSMSFGPDRGFLTPPPQSNGGSISQNRQGPSSAPPAGASSSVFGYNLDSNTSNSGSRIYSRGEYTPHSQQANIMDDIYEAPTTIITPSKRGNGVTHTRNSPY